MYRRNHVLGQWRESSRGNVVRSVVRLEDVADLLPHSIVLLIVGVVVLDLVPTKGDVWLEEHKAPAKSV